MRNLLAAFAILSLAACATTPPPNEGVRVAQVSAPDSAGFFRQRGGAWIEFAPNGLARFTFIEERSEGDVAIILDESRNVRLRLDPIAMTITEDSAQGWRPLYQMSGVIRGRLPFYTTGQPVSRVERVWFTGGGGVARDNRTWVIMQASDGFPEPLRWCLERISGEIIFLRRADAAAELRIEPNGGVVTLVESSGARREWGVRGVDYAPAHRRDPDFPAPRAEPDVCD